MTAACFKDQAGSQKFDVVHVHTESRSAILGKLQGTHSSPSHAPQVVEMLVTINGLSPIISCYTVDHRRKIQYCSPNMSMRGCVSACQFVTTLSWQLLSPDIQPQSHLSKVNESYSFDGGVAIENRTSVSSFGFLFCRSHSRNLS